LEGIRVLFRGYMASSIQKGIERALRMDKVWI